MPQKNPEQEVAAVRAFNRFYTRKLGVLDQQLAEEPVLAERGAGALRTRPSRRRSRPRRSGPNSASMPAISAASCRISTKPD